MDGRPGGRVGCGRVCAGVCGLVGWGMGVLDGDLTSSHNYMHTNVHG